MSKYIHKSRYFYGHEISPYGLENGWMDYRTLSRAFDMVMNNSILEHTWSLGEWEIVNGSEILYYDNSIEEYVDYDDVEDWDNISETYVDIYQYFIISNRGFDILSELTDEIVFYSETLDMYVWGVTHCGTSWDYVLTDIKIELEDN